MEVHFLSKIKPEYFRFFGVKFRPEKFVTFYFRQKVEQLTIWIFFGFQINSQKSEKIQAWWLIENTLSWIFSIFQAEIEPLRIDFIKK